MPADNQIYRVIEAALNHHGFNVISVIMDNLNFRYPSLSDRLKVKFRQLVLRDKNAKKKLISTQLMRDVKNKLIMHSKADYALFIRGDVFSLEFLDMIKRHTRHGNMINYQWDGIDRFPAIWDCADRFDRIYVFDPPICEIRNILSCQPPISISTTTSTCPKTHPTISILSVGIYLTAPRLFLLLAKQLKRWAGNLTSISAV